MGAAASSSSSAALPPKKYDVFISFRGEDTRTNFTSHLYGALRQKSVETYIDNRLQKGDEISQELIKAIHDSSVSVVVFSENYASSKWCLDELTQILKCREEGQMVIPIFYKVDPSDVRNQNASYKEAFAKHERDFLHKPDKVKMWRDALFQAANLAGWHSSTCRDEYELIQNIVNDILKKLDVVYPSALESLVGIDENCKSIESLLEEVPTIGIWGMGGIGKTTMARAVFTKLSSQYESCCFLENVSEMSERHGLNYIRDKLVKELLAEEISHGSTSKVSEFEFVRRRLSHKKVFIVLDDVSSSKDLDDLARECGCLGPGSRVIITTRDKHVLIGRVKVIYEAKSLSYHQSLKLFSMKAFHKNQPENGYEELSESFVTYTNGIPLALVTSGSLLYSKTAEEWNSALAKIEETPDGSIQRALKLSYDGLDYKEKEMFLDIACFLEGEDKEKVITLFESFGYHASIGIRSLLDKALITIDHYQLRMHDLIKETGREFVRQECIEEPGRRSRLWDHEDIYEVLKNNKGTDRVESIISNVSHMRHVSLSANTFRKMANLRFLKFYSSSYEISSNVNLPSGLESFSDRLRYFQWDGYPLESLPATFCAENLVELHMRGSSLKKIWNGMQDLVNLKIVNLQRSVQLVELPDFSKAPNLELVDLSFCQSLCNVHPSILSLPSLDTLRLFGCSSLKSLHSERHSKSLRTLDVLGCHSLNEFSLSSEKITSLNLEDTRIEILHPSIVHLNKLQSLILNGSTLKNFPINEMCCLTSLAMLKITFCGQLIDEQMLHILFDALHCLHELYLEGCSNLAEVPKNISGLSSLMILSLDGSNVESLPSSIKHLSKLECIYLRGCWRLRSLPQLPPFLLHLDATGCTSLETAFTLSTNYKMISVFLVNCMKMDEHSLWGIMMDAYFSLMRLVYSSPYCLEHFHSKRSGFCYPGSRVPEWFGYNQTTKASITIELAPTLDNLMGFIFCVVLPQFTSRENCIIVQVFLEDGGEVRHQIGQEYWEHNFFKFLNSGQVFLNSNHVLLWYSSQLCQGILHEVNRKLNEQGTTYNPKVSFEFKSNFCDCLIKEYGVYPFYALEDHNLVEEWNSHFKRRKWKKTKRHLGINEEEQLPPKKKLKASIDVIDLKFKELDQKIEELILKNFGN